MGFTQKLAMRQGQSLVMTPQLSQSIKLLTLSNIELSAFVEAEIEKNPFLEGESSTVEQREAPSAAEQPNEQITDLTKNVELETSALALSENLGTSIENVYPDEQDYRSVTKENAKTKEGHDHRITSGGLQVSGQSFSHDMSVADYTACHENLRDKLNGQLSIAGATQTITMIAKDIIENLDDSGYLRSQTEDIAGRLGCDHSDILEALELVQSFEPSGVGARDLSECLKIQLAEKNRLDPAMEIVVDNLDLLAKRDFSALQKLSGLEIEDLHDALMEIQSLDPKPGTLYESAPVQHIVPDVHVSEANDGSWRIELNADTLPKVLVNNSYVTEVSSKLSKSKEKEFLTDCLQTATWLTKSLDQRAQTILKVAREIVKQQDAFLVHGVRHLRPLTLRQVADEIEMHESSVSRVTSNKYMMTPRGLFELKYFFTTGISNAEDGESHSSESVRDRIRSLIDSETATSILSDDAIVEALKLDGIDIARRTIAKYRESMQIPSSVQRRREKRALEAARRAQGDEPVHTKEPSLASAH